jgi:hypothetical protein
MTNMEFNCPECGKRLRAPDHLRNPLVRCRTCSATFRPREEAITNAESAPQSIPRPTLPVPQQDRKFIPGSPDPLVRPFPANEGKKTAKGFGVGILILFIALTKGPKLIRLFLPAKPAAPAPVQPIDPKHLQILHDLQRQMPPPNWHPPVAPTPPKVDPSEDPFLVPPPSDLPPNQVKRF